MCFDTQVKRNNARELNRRRIRLFEFFPWRSSISHPCSPWIKARTPARRPAQTPSIPPQFRVCTTQGPKRRRARAKRRTKRAEFPGRLCISMTGVPGGRSSSAFPDRVRQRITCSMSGEARFTHATIPFSMPPRPKACTTWTTRKRFPRSEPLHAARPLESAVEPTAILVISFDNIPHRGTWASERIRHSPDRPVPILGFFANPDSR